MQFPVTHDFIAYNSDEEQTMKLFEEVSELHNAIRNDEGTDRVLEESMDVFQTLANLLEPYSQEELQAAYDRVFIKNWNRGYYECNYGGMLYEQAEAHYKELTGCQ